MGIQFFLSTKYPVAQGPVSVGFVERKVVTSHADTLRSSCRPGQSGLRSRRRSLIVGSAITCQSLADDATPLADQRAGRRCSSQ